MTLEFEGVFQRAPVPTMALDRQFSFVAANDAYLGLFGLASDEVIGRHVFDVFPESEGRIKSLTDVFEQTFSEGAATVSEIPFRVPINGKVVEQWWTARHVRIADSEDGDPFLVQYTENVTERVKLRKLRAATMAELQHRIGNMLTVVSAISRQTAREATDVPDFTKRFDARLASLVKVNEDWTGQASHTDTLRNVVMRQLAVHAATSLDRVAIAGEDVTLSMMQAQALSMAVHELATNAIKYGALSNAGGRIEIEWSRINGSGWVFEWREAGVQVPKNGATAGYGTMLLTTVLPHQLDGNASRAFDGGRFTYRLEIGTTS